MTELTKIVIPVAGMGTRVLPASKVVPKELLAVVDKPVIQHVIEEATGAGFREIILVTSPSKRSVEAHFEPHPELEDLLESRGKTELLAVVRDILPDDARIFTVFQDEPRGLGHAIGCAADLVGSDDFGVSLPDVLIFNPDGDHGRDLRDIATAFRRNQAAQLMVEAVPDDQVDRYGIVDCGDVEFEPGVSHAVKQMVEKPAIGEAPSNQSIIGRYVLPSRIMQILKNTEPGAGGEIQLTDAINALIAEMPVEASSMYGKTYDCGNILGYMMANAAFAMAHPEYGADFRHWLKQQEL